MLITIIFIAIIASIFIADSITSKKSKKKMENDLADLEECATNGIYAEGAISRVKSWADSSNTSHRGKTMLLYTNYVKYIGDDNAEHEAKVANLHIDSLPYNKIIGIKYRPGKYEECICVDLEPGIEGGQSYGNRI